MENKPSSDIIVLPFWETVRRSFLYVVENFDVLLKVTSIWFALLIYEMFNGFPSICNISDAGCYSDWRHKVSIVLISLASIAVVVAFCRHVILKLPVKYFMFSFGMRELKYMLFNIVFISIITIISIVSIFLLAYVMQWLRFPESWFNITILIPLAFTIYACRFFLVFPGIAVEDKEMTFKDSYRITFGNANRIFWGQFLMMIPAAVLIYLTALLYNAIGSDNYIVKFVFSAFILFLSFLDSCFKASFFSHIYQYFTYFKKKPIPLSEVENAIKETSEEQVSKPKKTSKSNKKSKEEE